VYLITAGTAVFKDAADKLLQTAFTASALTFPNRPVMPKKPGGFA